MLITNLCAAADASIDNCHTTIVAIAFHSLSSIANLTTHLRVELFVKCVTPYVTELKINGIIHRQPPESIENFSSN